ncbi:DUF1800 family protein [Ilumatobacter sp.]|uniref:DUF1800 family protein n=1 Tax=Ilumatobacter sp. TaxID=1967498 RepID=UPI003B51A27F
MPELNEANVRHLLRRTEFVDRPARVAHLLTLGSIGAAVDDVMDVSADPPSASLTGDSTWRRGQAIVAHWMDQMAGARRPFAERMAFFWHGHLCSELGKVNSAPAMQEQIDLFRRRGLGPAANGGNVDELVRTMSIQIAMLRYLDNVDNRASSPNQNFARELMELFLLGVGNYTEADVEAATSAWTGHGQRRWDIDEYVYRDDQHHGGALAFLGRTINVGARSNAGNEVIEVILGTGPLGAGTIPAGSPAGDRSDVVAADFLSRKLWQELGEAASGRVPSGVAAAMRSALISNGFDIRPWVRAMLTHDDFYAPATRTGLVRQPVEYAVALMVATGLGSSQTGPLWVLERTGQQLLYPPNVSGWKPNGYWVNASAMGARQRLAQGFIWDLQRRTWSGDDRYLDLPGGRLSDEWMKASGSAEVVERVLRLTHLTDSSGSTGPASPISDSTRRGIVGHLSHAQVHGEHRLDALLLALTAPDMHIA